MGSCFYCISHLVRAVSLVNFAGRTSLNGPLNLKVVPFPTRLIILRDIINISLTSFLGRRPGSS